jgi:hypothetical protein
MLQDPALITTRAFFEALHARERARAVEFADREALVAWQRIERAYLANLLLPLGAPELEPTDTTAIEAVLQRHVSVNIEVGGIGTLSALTSLSAPDYLARYFELRARLFGIDPKREAAAFTILGDVSKKGDTTV